MDADRWRSLLATARERTGTVRVRTTMGAALVVGVALLVASMAMVLLLRRSLTEDVRAAARMRAQAVGAELDGGTPAAQIALEDGEEEFVQIIGPGGAVVAPAADAGAAPLVRLDPGASARLRVPFDDDPFLAVALSVRTSRGPLMVVVGRSLDNVDESSAAVAGLLATGVPLLLLFVAGVTWRVVGKALAPVETIRGEVDAISTEELHRRVPVPPTTDEIARLAVTMNQMLQRLQEGQARQRRFVSDASHELRSPVATIRQNAEVALLHPGATSIESLAGLVLAEDLRLQRLVEDLLLLTRLDEEASAGRGEVVDLDDILFREVDRIRQGTDKTIDTGRVSAGRVLGDGRRLSRMVANLLANALRYSSGSIAVSLVERGDAVILRISDDGPGVPVEDRQRIFERFVRLEEARDRDSGGAGLGLAIVAEVAQRHGGTATALDGALGGACFEVRIPRFAG